MAVVVGLMTLWALDEVRGAADERARVEDGVALVSTRETVLYLAATRDLTLGGLPVRAMGESERALRRLDEFGSLRRDPFGDELRLDGRTYEGFGATTFTLQDEAGLYPLVWPSPNELDRLLAALEIERQAVPRLRDAFLDYIDSDGLRRLHGAEAREYEREGRAAPLNRRLRLPAEVSRVLGWSDLPDQRLATIPDLITTFYSGAINPNTMPPAVLETIVPGCPEKCELLMRHRDRKPFASSAELQTRLGVRLPGDDAIEYRYVAAEDLRLTFSGRSGRPLRMHVRLTPLADEAAPWAVLAAYPVPRSPYAAPAHTIDSDLFADASAGRP